MNYTKHLLVPIICLLLLSCSKDNDENTDNNTPSTKTSLPVKATRKDANGTVIRTTTYSYDSQNRLKTLKVVDANASLNLTQTISYENGKITSLMDYDDPAKPLEKRIYFYDGNGIKNEEFYSDNILNFRYEWYYRPDGGKERRVKYTSGALLETYYYRFSATGNIERMIIDNASASQEDYEYNFSSYDNKSRTIANDFFNDVIPYILLGFPGTNLPAPNNPLALNLKIGNTIIKQTYEYTYNNKNQVTAMKAKDPDNGNLLSTRTIEYQEF
jgi:hypothetical protein